MLIAHCLFPEPDAQLLGKSVFFTFDSVSSSRPAKVRSLHALASAFTSVTTPWRHETLQWGDMRGREVETRKIWETAKKRYEKLRLRDMRCGEEETWKTFMSPRNGDMRHCEEETWETWEKWETRGDILDNKDNTRESANDRHERLLAIS